MSDGMKRLPMDMLFPDLKEGEAFTAIVIIVRYDKRHEHSREQQWVCVKWTMQTFKSGRRDAPCCCCHARIEADKDGGLFPAAYFLVSNPMRETKPVAVSCVCEECAKKEDAEIASIVMKPYMNIIGWNWGNETVN
jgi:hypothetical protein